SSRTDRGVERCRQPPQEELERLASQPRLSKARPTVSRPFRPHRVVNFSTQGVGLRPWALGSGLPARWAGWAVPRITECRLAVRRGNVNDRGCLDLDEKRRISERGDAEKR